jgi:hypothetical protein
MTPAAIMYGSTETKALSSATNALNTATIASHTPIQSNHGRPLAILLVRGDKLTDGGRKPNPAFLDLRKGISEALK